MGKNNYDVLHNVALFDLQISVWSGRNKLSADDLKNLGMGRLVEDVPADVVNLGSKRIFPQEILRTFASLKYYAEKKLREHGFRSYSAFVVPRSCVDEIVHELEQLRDQYEAKREELRANYAHDLRGWAAAHPDWQDVIIAAAPSADHVCAKLQFKYRYVLITSEEAVGEQGGDSVANSLVDELLGEIRDEANEFWDSAIKGRNKVPRVSLKRLDNLRKKMASFSFIDARITPMIRSLDYALSQVPEQGNIEASAYDAINSAVLLLADPGRSLAYGQAVLDPVEDDSDDDLVDEEAGQAFEEQTEDQSREDTPVVEQPPAERAQRDYSDQPSFLF